VPNRDTKNQPRLMIDPTAINTSIDSDDKEVKSKHKKVKKGGHTQKERRS